MKISEFFSTDYVDFGSYDNLRKIASIMDGQKNAARKILYTVMEKNIKDEIKVSQLGSKVAEFAEYLHGNLDGVIVNLAQRYPGTNNISLLTPEGNFGTRFSQEASASRYIFTYASEEFFKYFNKDDNAILVEQTFEGSKIEPRFYVPELPILLINGSEGVSSGFAQKILPRNPHKIKNAIINILNDKPHNEKDLYPYYEGFTGTITQGETINQWLIVGVAQRVGINKVVISEVPIGYDLRGYIDVLDDLEDRKIIQSYVDKSENDKFLFEVNIPSKTLKEWDEETLLTKLKLIKRVSENYTVIDEENRIRVFENALQLLNHYVKVKLKFLDKRKAYQIEKIKSDIEIDYSKYAFIKKIIDGKLIINNRKKADIENDLEAFPDIIARDGGYDYLLNMNIISLTSERMERLYNDVQRKKDELVVLEKTSIVDMWMNSI